MNIREQIEEREELLLSPYAAKSRDVVRDEDEAPDPLRTAFQRDRDRIIHSKCFRRLKHKTQVYIAPGDHYRTRMTHTLEVGQIGRTVARALRLNEDLVEAIAMGHDVGHTPFGHVGEYALRDMVGHFNHNEQSLRMVEVLEKHGEHQGLNLTSAVRNGILGHTGPTIPVTLEGQIIRIVDRIAYLCHDFDDAQRAGMLQAENLPLEVREHFGMTPSSMITAMVEDMVRESLDKPAIAMSDTVEMTMNILRKFMFKHVYLAPALIPDRSKASHVVKNLFVHFMEHPHDMEECTNREGFYSTRDVVDYVAGLTDQYAIKLFKQYYIPNITL
ncbi:deoxyguanosinetriphosphate triphosphohydrolase [Veillonella denticariosi JCM 15641]|uniref:Deoxyguanosinetriphosphate triphosphohydrolase n=1 Tax=Veillonella denticariosi JCM 15641 TaxID=1298594 RepID=A0A2S7Z7H0_9FIRM|nr:deoxyguanosinetriphosphate triphosphohydrolase [Veillonella denticariosi]PQL19234.1 deoxyguanosinetriphosphate triphosphohydrolase [Veillonella denticariosi JCM 15641]